MSAAVSPTAGVIWSVHPLTNGGHILVWPAWAGLSDDLFLSVVNEVMGNQPERWTITATDSPLDHHGAWLIEPL
jgi:hypothetical protein